MNIAIAYSPDWAPHVAVEVHALFATNPAPIKVYLIGDTGSAIDIPCPAGCSVEFIDVEQLFKEKIPSTVNVDSRFTKYALYRLLLPDIIPEDRLLYIDADAIVNGDITEFYNMDMDGALVAGVIDTGILPEQLAAIGLNQNDVYINAGVTLMDLAAIRAAGIPAVWLREINERYYSCHDQCIINWTCRGKIKTVGNEYNSSLSTGFPSWDPNVKIMHWAGQKPWNTTEVPLRDIWQRWSEAYKAAPKDRIPKHIHYCWFGNKPKPPIVQKCIDSWRRHLPGYICTEWSEHNFNIDENPYIRAAFNAGKYAFVTDYVRMAVLHEHGGIYLDSDVEVLQPLDRFLKYRCFTGHEIPSLWVTAVMGAEPGHPWIKMLKDYYQTAVYDGYTPNTQTITRLSQSWLERQAYGFKYLREGVVIFPEDTFCGFNHAELKPVLTENSYAVHHFAGSWTARGQSQ